MVLEFEWSWDVRVERGGSGRDKSSLEGDWFLTDENEIALDRISSGVNFLSSLTSIFLPSISRNTQDLWLIPHQNIERIVSQQRARAWPYLDRARVASHTRTSLHHSTSSNMLHAEDWIDR